jgi:predicted transcriptional regulator
VENQSMIEHVADIVSAHVSNNAVAVRDLPTLILNVHGALNSLGAPPPMEEESRKPAVSIRSSVKPDYITCLDCGSRQKILKRHLQTAHHLTPDQYRKEFGLPQGYPLVAPNYAEKRRALAHRIGFGRGGRVRADPEADSEPTGLGSD